MVTKGPMVVRDKDVLLEASRRASCTVMMSVPTVDEAAWRMLEPGTAHPLQRLRAVRELNDAGIRAGVLMAPIVPGLTSQPAKLEATIKAIADHGAAFVGANLLYLKEGTRVHFMRFLEKNFPELWRRSISSSMRRRTRPPAYAKEVRGNGEADTEEIRRDGRRGRNMKRPAQTARRAFQAADLRLLTADPAALPQVHQRLDTLLGWRMGAEHPHQPAA